MMKDKPRLSTMDILTVIGVASIAYVFATALHEYLGHATACVALGGRVTELNAFYINCDYTGMSDLSIRGVAFAGPLVSFLTGIIAFAFFSRLKSVSPTLRVWLWLLGSIGLMTATGYMLFSGLSGLGDFGISRDGFIYSLNPEWLWRLLLTIIGMASYIWVVRISARRMEEIIGGSGPDRVKRAQRLSLVCYISGGIVSVVIGLFNPQGLIIVLISSAAASLGGTSGLAWGMQFMNHQRQTTTEPLKIPRDWRWISAAIIVVLLYGAIFGPSIKF